MKKLLLTAATVGLSILPVAGASAEPMNSGTNISGSQNQSASMDSNKSSNSNSSQEAYYNNTVDYESLSYIKYDASTTAYTNDMQSAANRDSWQGNYMNNTQSQFSMPSWMTGYNSDNSN